ncbi:hypothetical protein [uncultured Rikenella sp.]|uniref:hypothetical protein n=1 Tax=uncultured Rikenella sp. TaxID=368003 RepID=UPI0025CEBC85|nr:hypothetical protein [uncultured Rikenella sp.]
MPLGINGTPAPGLRYHDTGALDQPGYGGVLWSASAVNNSTYAWRLVFGATNLLASYASNRGDGFLLRCLSE